MTEKAKEAKPGWRTVKFGDVVRLSKARSQDPIADGLERYVGLEHLEPGDLRIRTWGNVADGITFNSRFEPGQVLFGKRRAYQRKVAVADFAGVCSGDIYVLESQDPAVLLPELLPFICQTDAFFDHAVGTSAGSLSPRTNWTSLSAFELLLPSHEAQENILNRLRAAESVLCTIKETLDAAAVVRTGIVESALSDACNESKREGLGNHLRDVSYGLSLRSNSQGKGYPILGIPNVLRGKIDLTDIHHVELSTKEYDRFCLRPGDVLIVRTNGNPLYVGRSIVIQDLEQETVYASYLIRLRSNVDSLRPAFLTEYLNAPSTRQRLRAEVRSSAGNYNLNTLGIKKQPICAPSVDAQDATIAILADIDSARSALECRQQSAMAVKQKMLTSIWGRDVQRS